MGVVSVLLAALLAAQVGLPSISGVVHDGTGAAVPDATVVARSAAAGGGERQTRTGPDGRFTIDAPSAGDIVLVVRAGGSAEQSLRLSGATPNGALDVTLVPASLLETVTVTATRSDQRVVDVPASVNLVTREQIS